MSLNPKHLKVVAIGVTCAAAGAGASAIATAGAASRAATTSAHPRARAAVLARAVHADVVVATKSDRGFVSSLSGRQLTIREGTKTRTYKTVTLTIPAGARVRDNGKAATLGQLTDGQRVSVLRGPRRTTVVARTPRTG
jgi:hypothetical protein